MRQLRILGVGSVLFLSLLFVSCGGDDGGGGGSGGGASGSGGSGSGGGGANGTGGGSTTGGNRNPTCDKGTSAGEVQAPTFVRNVKGQTSWFASPIIYDLDGDGKR
ncbi:MAG TPA: hypothetical protein PKD61_19765, partial [Polyangiaceae bacterium]|nr:hypothetical protein [Polyangiaceae bacterium]